MTIEVHPVQGITEISAGDDLVAVIAAAADLRDRDVVVVAQKIVSKAEGAIAEVEPGESPDAARRRLARAQAVRIVVEDPVLVCETRHGFVCANAGVDASNVPGGRLTLLPADPDASARRLRDGLAEHSGVDVAVIIADTFGRPWRMGQTDVAIGVAGMSALRDERGGHDRHGQRLDVTEVALADEVAATADLVRRKDSGLPVIIVRGLAWEPASAGARELVRPPEDDLFPRGRGMLAAALGAPGPAPSGQVPERSLDQALAAARRVADPQSVACHIAERPSETILRFVPSSAQQAALAGAAAATCVAALLDLGCAAHLQLVDPRHGVVEVRAGRVLAETATPANR